MAISPYVCIDIIDPMNQTLTLLAETLTVHRLSADTDIPPAALKGSFLSVTRTEDELSLVLPESVELESQSAEPGWACFKVEGPLDFGLTGILAGIAGALAEAGISIFALSTYDTDYILVKREQVRAAQDALTSAGYQVLHQGV